MPSFLRQTKGKKKRKTVFDGSPTKESLLFVLSSFVSLTITHKKTFAHAWHISFPKAHGILTQTLKEKILHKISSRDSKKVCKMIQSKPLFTKVIMSALTVALSSFAVLGSGLILAVIARYKSLRTVPNVLIGNLAAVDLLNAVIYMPIQITYSVLEVSWYRGQALAIATSLVNRLFAILNLASMLLLLANMYFAIAFDLKY